MGSLEGHVRLLGQYCTGDQVGHGLGRADVSWDEVGDGLGWADAADAVGDGPGEDPGPGLQAHPVGTWPGRDEITGQGCAFGVWARPGS